MDLGKGLACRGRCEADTEALISLIQGNVERAPVQQQLVDVARKNRYAGPVFMILAGLFFAGFASYQSVGSGFNSFCAFNVGLGTLFLVYGVVTLLRVVAIVRIIRSQNRKRP